MTDQFAALKKYWRLCALTFVVWFMVDLNGQLRAFPTLFGAINVMALTLVLPAFLDIFARKLLAEKKYLASNICSTIAAAISEILNLVPGNPYAKGLPFFLMMQVLTLNKLEKAGAAEVVATRLVSHLKHQKPINQMRLAYAIVLLGNALMLQGRFEEAEKATREAIEIFEGQKDAKPITIAASLSDLCATLAREGRSRPAIEIGKRALHIAENTSQEGDEVVIFGMILNNLAIAYNHAGQSDRALELYQRSLKIKLHTLGDKCREAVIGYNNVGFVLSEQKQYAKAVELLERAKQVAEELNLKGSRIWPNIVTNCGDVHRALGRFEEAEKELFEGLHLRQRKKSSKDLHESFYCLGKYYRDKKEFDKGEEYFRKALTMREKQFGKEHHKVCQTLEDYALLLRESHREAEAEQFDLRIKAIREELQKENV